MNAAGHPSGACQRCTHNESNVISRAGELAQTVYDLNRKKNLRTSLRRINLAGKWISILFPLVTILLLRVPAIQRQFVIFILVADLPCTPPPTPLGALNQHTNRKMSQQ